MPNILTQFTSVHSPLEKQESSSHLIDVRPGLSLLFFNNKGRNGDNTKSNAFGCKNEMVPLLLNEKDIENLTIPALKDELRKRNL